MASWQSHIVLRLTDGSSNAESSAAYFRIPQQVNLGFNTYFQFQIHNPTICCNPADGFAFILQNSSATNTVMGASGSGIHALGAGGGGMGYAGINNSLAIEFDIYSDPWDPNSNHVAIQTCGGNPSVYNTPVHLSGVYTIGQDNDVTSCLLASSAINTSIPTLGGTCSGTSCTDGNTHQVVIEYTPPPQNQQEGLLQVWLDPIFLPGSHTPEPGYPTVLSVPYNIVYAQNNQLGLELPKDNGLLVGFTGSQPSQGQALPSGGTTTDIVAWDFTAFAPVQITEPIANGGTETDFAFGPHQMAVNYPSGFMNCNPTCINMTVLATPWNQQTFYTQRLQGTQFANENCIIYLSTGGNCIVYSVTCQDSSGNNITCPTEPPPNPPIAICTQFSTPEPVSELNTDFLEAEPIGSNNWCSIFYSFTLNNDPVTTGKGTGFSDIVATLSPTGPGMQCSSGSRYLEKITEKMEQKAKPRQPQGSGFCPSFSN